MSSGESSYVNPEEYQFKRTFETDPVGMSLADVLHGLRYSARFFIQFMIPEELEYPIPDFHVEAWDLLTCTTIYEIALALPRGHAKTTLLKLCAIWYWLFTPTRFIIYVSNTQPIAAGYCQDIAEYLKSPNFERVFGRVHFTVEQDNKGLYRFNLRVPNLTTGEWQEKHCILKSSGALTQTRGILLDNTRPELALVDDLEDQENTSTSYLVKKLWGWFFGTFKKALTNKRPKIIYAGNLLSKDSMLHYFCSDGNSWFSRRYGCIRADGTVLWPDVWPMDRIRIDFREYQKMGLMARWFAEMMNLPIADGQGLIKAEEIPYAEPMVPGQQEMAFITVDPAFSKETYGNKTAIVVHAYLNGKWRIVQYIFGKYDPGELFWLLADLCDYWNTRAVVVEQAGFQKVLQYVFQIMGEIHKKTFETLMLHHNNKSKTERLMGFCAVLRQGVWALVEGDFEITEQLLAYDPLKKHNDDDLIDACSMGPPAVKIHMAAIAASYQIEPQAFQPKIGYEVQSN
jgi:hypothetical protein